MKTIVLISCGALQNEGKMPACELYKSQLFKVSLVYARMLTSDENIYILSTKYGLLKLTDKIEPYDIAMKKGSKKPNSKVLTSTEKKAWGEDVVANLKKVADIQQDKFIILAGEDYVEPLEVGLKNITLPLEGVPLLKRVKKLKELINKANQVLLKNLVPDLHEIFSQKKRYTFPLSESDKKGIPANGIYIFFEEGEKFGSFDRIVRVGTHKKEGRLLGRLQEHFTGNMKGSSFRKFLGATFLKENMATSANVEEKITEYLKNKTSFIVFEVETQAKRLFWEGKIASTLAQSDDFKNAISENWLGRKSPELKIRENGLWQTQKIGGEILTTAEFEELKNLITQQ